MARKARRSAPKPSGRDCPHCRQPLDRRDLAAPRPHPVSLALYVGGAVVSVIWAAALIKNQIVVVPHSIGGIAVVGLLYLAPGLVLGWIGARLPRQRSARCADCGWTGAITLRS